MSQAESTLRFDDRGLLSVTAKYTGHPDSPLTISTILVENLLPGDIYRQTLVGSSTQLESGSTVGSLFMLSASRGPPIVFSVSRGARTLSDAAEVASGHCTTAVEYAVFASLSWTVGASFLSIDMTGWFSTAYMSRRAPGSCSRGNRRIPSVRIENLNRGVAAAEFCTTVSR